MCPVRLTWCPVGRTCALKATFQAQLGAPWAQLGAPSRIPSATWCLLGLIFGAPATLRVELSPARELHFGVFPVFVFQGRLWGSTWSSQRRFKAAFGGTWAPLGLNLAPLGLNLAPLGLHLEPLGRLLGSPWGLLGASWAQFGTSWCQLDPSWDVSGSFLALFGLQVVSKWPPSVLQVASKWPSSAL